MRSRVTALAAGQPLRRAVVALYVATSVAVVLQRGIVGPQHNVFRIFRQSFWHLVAGRNLYTAYPSEQGGAPADLFKYSPTAALFFAPFALPPYGLALLAWSLLGALLLFRGASLPPAYCGVVVVRAGIDNGIGFETVREIKMRSRIPKSELQNSHARHLETAAQMFHFGSNSA